MERRKAGVDLEVDWDVDTVAGIDVGGGRIVEIDLDVNRIMNINSGANRNGGNGLSCRWNSRY